MIALGINGGHSSSAALVKDGVVAACVSEERFSRLKNDEGYPVKAVEYVLKAAKVSAADCDRIVLPSHTMDPIAIKIKRVARYKISDYMNEMYEYWKPELLENSASSYWDDIQNDPRFTAGGGTRYNFDFLKNTPKENWPHAFRQERIKTAAEHLGVPAEKITFLDHHTAHAYYAYFASPICRSRRTAVITADGWGDGANATISVAQGNTIKEIHRTDMCNLARLYRWMTLLLGMRPNEHEYKVMGLAPYAKDYIKQPAYKIFKENLAVDGMDFKWDKKPPDMYFYYKERFERAGARFDGIAGGLQQYLEELLTEWVSNVLAQTGADSVVYSGGLSMNVKANKAIAELPQVKEFFVPPSGSDESVSIGAAFAVCYEKDHIEPLRHAYLGSSVEKDEVDSALKEYRASERFCVLRQPSPEDIAGFLADGKVIGRCAGPMEFGARALGNRSILCDPSEWENVRKINEKIKFRDFWMPFTPTILSERMNDYIVNPKGLKAPFMTVAFGSTALARKQLKAAIHPYDFTIRPQILEQHINPEYYNIVKAFEKKTGIGAVLNTSLNLHGEPIVRTASEAMRTFVDSGLDGILLPGILLLKRAH